MVEILAAAGYIKPLVRAMRKPRCIAVLAVLCTIPGMAQTGQKDFLVKPYLQFATQHSIRILWETTEPGTTRVRYGPAKADAVTAALPLSLTTAALTAMHETELNGLEPETGYFYQVESVLAGGDTLRSEINPFQTAVRDSSAFAFTVFSDSQERPAAWGNIVRLAERERPDFALHAGDLVDLGYIKKDWVSDFLAPAYDFMKKYPLYSIMGNHEHDAAWYYQYMSNPEPEYRYHFRYGNAEFFMVDTDQPLAAGSEMYDWLEQALARSTANWKIVVHHYSPWSSDADDFGDTRVGLSGQGDPDVRGLAGLYEKYGVDLVFSGHLHLYERTWPLTGRHVDDTNGVVYVITGGAGGDTEPAAPLRSWFTKCVRTIHHFCYVSIHGDQLQFKAIDEQGQLFDYFDLKQSRKNKTAERKPAAPVYAGERRVFTDTMMVSIERALPAETVRYSLDGSEPDLQSQLYTKPLVVSKTTTIRSASFNRNGKSRVNSAVFSKEKMAAPVMPADVQPGLAWHYFTGTVRDEDPDKFTGLTFTDSGFVSGPDPGKLNHPKQNWGAVYEGFIKIPADGYYRFDGHADHIFRLHINNKLLIEELDEDTNFHSGLFLHAGYHRIRIDYYDRRPDRSYLEFYYSGPGLERQPVPDSVFFHPITSNK